ncbi:cytochrome P450 2F2-like isoform X2 [Notamacropus eugenii]|uniref:cytochrome P450 2F2-like isoform X2 n=1 Tax=Notamacropus eugenii TaxID=9315 RepID=UPI003B679F33
MDWIVIALLLLSITCLLLAKGVHKTKGRLPPGPRPLPLLGNLLQLRSRDMLASLTKLSQEYGPIFTVHLGTRPVVVLSGYEAVKEALVDKADEFSGRGEYPVFHDFTKGNGAPFDPTFVLSRSVSNIICSVIFGSRFDYEDERLLKIIQLINDNFKIMSSPWGEMYNIFPGLLRWIPGPHHRLFQNYGCMKDLIDHSIHEHQARLDSSCPLDFIDCFLIKMAEEAQRPDSYFHMETLVKTTHNLLFGGTETVGTTLRHAFLLLMKYPHIQARVQEEIDHVVGRGRRPTLEDRSAMPYTDAVLHEVQRFADVIPMNLPHRVIRDTAFRGFLLPKGTDIITLLNTVHYDQTQFQTPKEFNPAHFLDSKKDFKKSPAFMPFSAGRRLCLGEPLARMELFLFLAGILQNFTLQPLCPLEEIDVTPLSSGLGNVPRPFQLRMLPR